MGSSFSKERIKQSVFKRWRVFQVEIDCEKPGLKTDLARLCLSTEQKGVICRLKDGKTRMTLFSKSSLQLENFLKELNDHARQFGMLSDSELRFKVPEIAKEKTLPEVLSVDEDVVAVIEPTASDIEKRTSSSGIITTLKYDGSLDVDARTASSISETTATNGSIEPYNVLRLSHSKQRTTEYKLPSPVKRKAIDFHWRVSGNPPDLANTKSFWTMQQFIEHVAKSLGKSKYAIVSITPENGESQQPLERMAQIVDACYHLSKTTDTELMLVIELVASNPETIKSLWLSPGALVPTLS